MTEAAESPRGSQRNRTPKGEKRAPGDATSLSPKQRAALNVLVGGASYAEAARQVGVRRETVSGWANHHAAFRAELARQQGNLRRSVRQTLEVAAADSVEALHEIVRSDPNSRTRVAAAKAILGLVADMAEKEPKRLPGHLDSFEERMAFSGEEDRKRMEELRRIPPQEREIMRVLFERLRMQAGQIADKAREAGLDPEEAGRAQLQRLRAAPGGGPS